MSAKSSISCGMKTPSCGWSARSCEKRGLLREGGRRAVGEAYSFIAAEKTNFPVAVMCRVLGVSRTRFHNWERLGKDGYTWPPCKMPIPA
jgi:hypothetical protein